MEMVNDRTKELMDNLKACNKSQKDFEKKSATYKVFYP